MIKDKNIASDALIQVSKIQGMGGVGPFTGDIFYVAKSGIQARTWLDGKVPSSNLHLTLTAALAKCVNGRGDVIYVCPEHTETIASAGGVTVNKSNVSIIGLGNGNARPKFSWSATDSSCLVTSANVAISNIITAVTVDEVVSMFSVTGAGCTLDRVDFAEYGALGATGQAIQFLLTTNASDDLTIQNCRHLQYTAAAADQVWIELVGPSNTRILNNSIFLTAKAATGTYVIRASTASIETELIGNRITIIGATIVSPVSFASGSTGTIAGNYIAMTGAAVLSTIIVGDAMHVFQNYATNSAATSGLITPAADVIT
jgi:hypothetical protein